MLRVRIHVYWDPDRLMLRLPQEDRQIAWAAYAALTDPRVCYRGAEYEGYGELVFDPGWADLVLEHMWKQAVLILPYGKTELAVLPTSGDCWLWFRSQTAHQMRIYVARIRERDAEHEAAFRVDYQAGDIPHEPIPLSSIGLPQPPEFNCCPFLAAG